MQDLIDSLRQRQNASASQPPLTLDDRRAAFVPADRFYPMPVAEAAKIVPLERLALSPQCGFASTIEGNKLTVDDEKRKLQLVVETAREVWGTA